MSIQSEINRLKQAVSDAFTAIGNKGGTVPTSKVIGNLVSAINSIPDGGDGVISAVATGTYTPASDISSGVEIAHGLSVTPHFCIWIAENDFSDITGVSAAVVGAMVAKPMLYSVSSGITYPYQYFLRGYTASGVSSGTTSYKGEGYMTDTIVTILGNNTCKLKSGWTYRWVAGVINA